MSVLAVFSPVSMTTKQYDQIIERLDQAGYGNPKGRLFHTCYGTGDKLQVADVWASGEDFQQFGQTLMPILQQVGVDVGQPQVSPIHNQIAGL